MFDLAALIRRDHKKLAASITPEASPMKALPTCLKNYCNQNR
jgi:hypothetical protein